MKTQLEELIELLRKEADFITDNDDIKDRYARSAYRHSIEIAEGLIGIENKHD